MGSSSSESDSSKSRQQRTMDKLYLEKDETGDVTFIVESKNIRAHKSVLAAISPKYKAQFYGLQPDKGEIIVNDVTAVVFEVFLQFFYLAEFKLALTTENIEGVLNLAKQSLVTEFVDSCAAFLLLQVKEMPLIYRLASFYDIKELEEICLLHISENTKNFFESESFFSDCNREMLLQIVKMDYLACREIEVFKSCISWAKAGCIQNGVDADRAQNLRKELGDVVYEIRFRSMTFKEFANLHRSYEGFFTPDESIEIMYMLGLKDFKSIKFNQTLRNEALLLNRIVIEEEKNDREVIAPVSFSCNKAIRLKGFAAGFQFTNNEYKLQINVTDDKDHCKEHRPKYTIQQEKDETIVTLESFIDIGANDQVEVLLEFPQLKIFTKYTVAPVMEVEDIKFTFNIKGEVTPGILLTKLFFYRNPTPDQSSANSLFRRLENIVKSLYLTN